MKYGSVVFLLLAICAIGCTVNSMGTCPTNPCVWGGGAGTGGLAGFGGTAGEGGMAGAGGNAGSGGTAGEGGAI